MTQAYRIERTPGSETRPMTREQRRSKRKRAVRAVTTSIKRLPKTELAILAKVYPKSEHPAPFAGGPITRAACKGGQRPCPYVSCEYHLYLDINPRTGSIKYNFPDLEPDQLTESCVLDIVDRGGATLEEVGAIMNLTRERIRQIEVLAMAKVLASLEIGQRQEYADEGGTDGRRRLPVIQPTSFRAAGEGASACDLEEVWLCHK